MSKLNKHAEVLERLKSMIKAEETGEKTAQEASGVPGKDTAFQSVGDGHDTTNKNEVGPDKLKPQEYEQKPSSDDCAPAKKGEEAVVIDPVKDVVEKKSEELKAEPIPASAKEGEKVAHDEINRIGKEILDAVTKLSQEKPSGVPGKDTDFTSVGDKHDKADKNKVGPDKLKPQEYNQKPSTDEAKPAAKSAEDKAAAETQVSEEELNKIASYELGKAFAEVILKTSEEQQLLQVKEAGRKDFETLIATAAHELEAYNKKQKDEKKMMPTEVASTAESEKKAEALGAAAFDELLKQAQAEQQSEFSTQYKALEAKLAAAEADKVKLAEEIKTKQVILDKQAEEAKEAKEIAKMSALAEYVKNQVIEGLRHEFVKTN